VAQVISYTFTVKAGHGHDVVLRNVLNFKKCSCCISKFVKWSHVCFALSPSVVLEVTE
jgi:hypothetical protein